MRVPVLVLICVALLAVPPPRVAAQSAGAVVAEVYGSGGNTGATYSRDFVELFNRSKQTVSLAGWKLQYAPKDSDRWSSTALTSQIAPYRYFLVALGGGSSGGAALPAPDVTGGTNLNGAAGVVRIIDAAGTTVDLVGYGAGTTSERRPAPGTSDPKHATTRKRIGCMDTDDNASDFDLEVVTARNHSSAFNRCDSPPALNTVGNHAAHAGSQLSFTLSAFDPDGDALTYSASNLPSGSTFYADSRTFAWRPTPADVGTHPGVRFAVSDGFSTDDETVTLGVAPRSASGRSQTSVAFNKFDRELDVHGFVSPDHRGFEVVVRLLRKTKSGWQLVALQRPVLDQSSSYRASFARAAKGECMLRTEFPGDDLHDPSVAQVELRC